VCPKQFEFSESTLDLHIPSPCFVCFEPVLWDRTTGNLKEIGTEQGCNQLLPHQTTAQMFMIQSSASLRELILTKLKETAFSNDKIELIRMQRL
jgi:hypothetical protein